MLRLATALIFVFSTAASSQHAHNHKIPAENGQSAFAAIAEIVQILRADPRTDWQKVNISALQVHLADMEMLATEATSKQSVYEDRVSFSVSGPKRAIEAIHRMVPAHAPFLEQDTGWKSEVALTGSGLDLIVTGDVAQIASLGFHGLMTIGAHHQEHHLGIALGRMTHN